MDPDRDSPLPSFIAGSYAARLGVALSFAIIVIIAVGVLTSVQASATLEEDVADDITALSETQAAQLDDWLTTSRRNVRSTSRLPVFTEGTATEKQQRLERLQTNEELPPGVVAVHYLDTETNEIRASSNREFIGVNAEEQGAPFATNPPQFDSPDDTHVTEPFSVSLVDHPIIAVVSPIPGDENRALVYMIDLREKADQISNQREGSFTTVVSTDGAFVSHPNTSMIGATAPISQMESNPLGPLEPGQSSFHETDSMLMGLTHLESQDWVVMVHSDPEAAYALSDQINSDLIGLILLAVVNLGLIGVTIGGNTIASLRRLSAKAEAMADGDLDIDLETSREDEFGTLYGAFDNMRTNLRTKISEAEEAKEQAEAAREEVESERNEMEELTAHLELKAQQYSDTLDAAANGDLTARVETDSMNEAMAEVGADINTTLDALEDTIADMKAFATNVIQSSDRVNTNAERVDRASKQVSKSINEIFEGTTEQNEGLESAAAEMQNLSATAQQVASSAQQVATTSQSAADVGEDGREAAQEAIAEMNAIEDETGETVEEINALDNELDEIGEIVGVITSIVEQTNMLALNASIEAAHADGDGEGFAVVADEIKGLAEETKEAAADIEQRIEGIQEQAGDTVETMESTSTRITEGVSTVEETVDALETIVEYTEEVDTGIQEIDRATEEQARTAQDVMETIDDLTTISQQTATEADTVAGAAQDQSASIDEVSDSATELRQRADDLESLLDRFTVENSAGTGSDSTAAVGDD